MDPLSALGIAAAVAQFLQFAGSLVSGSQQLYAEGALADHVECEKATRRLESLAKEVQSSLNDLSGLGKLSNDAKALRVICVRCSKLSEDLISRLNELRVDGKHRRWNSFRQALKSVCTQDKIEDIAAKLASCKDELNSHLIASIKRKADILILKQEEMMKAIQGNSRVTIATILESREILRNDLPQLNSQGQPCAPSSALVSLGDAQAVEIHLLLSLRFASMRDRQAEIPIAHQKTFRWIFEDQSVREDVPWSSFTDWLRTGSGIYWISGKAGSGKSTLMRYIFENVETRKHLNVWVGDHFLESHGFFFWNGGSLEQRSQCGLLRSLLYQALYARPNLVRDIFPDEVAENNTLLAHDKDEKWNWTLPALKRAFERWINQALNSSLSFCIFLDGLDEYEGDHEGIVDFFKGITSSHPSRIKLCISSRPWVVFDEAFEGLPRLRLQDLTYRDIEAYVHDELRAHPRMLQLAQAEPTHADELVTEIVTKASGVFLWVMLIIRSLLSGLRNRDDFSVLRKRLLHLPADLSSLYTHMLNHVDPLYNEQASQAFQIYGALFNENKQGAVTALELALATTATTATPHTSTSVTTSMTDEEVKAKCEDLDVHLKSRCAGLLEIHTGETQTWEQHRYFDPVKPTDKVNYLHRTVKDFLATEDVQERLLSDCTSEFNPHTYVINSFVSRLYRSVFITHLGTWYPASNEAVWAMIARAMKHAKRADLSGDRSYIAALDLLEHAGKRAWNFGQDPWKGQHQLPVFLKNTSLAWVKCDKTVMWIRNFVGEIIIHNLFAYINLKVRESNILLLDQEAMPLLCYAFQQNPSKFSDPPSPEMVALLLQRGADPDQRWLGKSMWQKLFSTTWKYTKDFVEAEILPSRVPALGKVVSQEQRQVLSILAQILKLYLEYEADTVGTLASDFRRAAGAESFHNFDEASIRRIISRIYVKYLPSSSPELLHALQMKMARDQRSDAKNGAKREYEREDPYGPRKRFHGANYS